MRSGYLILSDRVDRFVLGNALQLVWSYAELGLEADGDSLRLCALARQNYYCGTILSVTMDDSPQMCTPLPRLL